jgi:hypothetical protein
MVARLPPSIRHLYQLHTVSMMEPHRLPHSPMLQILLEQRLLRVTSAEEEIMRFSFRVTTLLYPGPLLLRLPEIPTQLVFHQSVEPMNL